MQVNWKPSQPNERYPRAALSPRAGRIARGFIVGCSSYGLWLVGSGIYSAVVSNIAPATVADAMCEPSDIRIIQADHHPPTDNEVPYGHVVGELVNDCDDAAGVVLRITLRDQAGNVLNSQSQTSMRL